MRAGYSASGYFFGEPVPLDEDPPLPAEGSPRGVVLRFTVGWPGEVVVLSVVCGAAEGEVVVVDELFESVEFDGDVLFVDGVTGDEGDGVGAVGLGAGCSGMVPGATGEVGEPGVTGAFEVDGATGTGLDGLLGVDGLAVCATAVAAENTDASANDANRGNFMTYLRRM